MKYEVIMTEIITKSCDLYARPLIGQFPKISPFPAEHLCLFYLSSASTPQLFNILLNKMGRRGAKPDPLVEKWFKNYTLKGVKTPVAECQAFFK